MPERSVAGRSIVTRRAIVDIISAAVQSSYGVTGFSDPSLGRRMLRVVGLDQPGIRLTRSGGLHLDLYITVAFGVPVAEVARQVDSAVRYSLRHYAGAEVAELTIHVDGMGYKPAAVEFAEEIERTETMERPGPAREHPQKPAGAEGAAAPRKRKPR